MENGSENERSSHSIRLRGPCQLIWMRSGTQQAEVRVHIPCEISSELFDLSEITASDTFVLRRSFGMPTGLGAKQIVTLELSEFFGAKRVALNPEKFPEATSDIDEAFASFDVTRSLLQKNRFEVEYGSLPANAGDAKLIIKLSH